MVLLFTSAACSMSKKAELNQSVKTESSASEDTSYRFIVSFISIGSGIDKKAKKYLSFVSERLNIFIFVYGSRIIGRIIGNCCCALFRQHGLPQFYCKR